MSTSVLVQSPWCLRQWAASFAQPFGWRKTYENMIWMDNIKTFWKWYLCWCIFTFDLSIILSNCFANCKSYFPWIQFGRTEIQLTLFSALDCRFAFGLKKRTKQLFIPSSSQFQIGKMLLLMLVQMMMMLVETAQEQKLLTNLKWH